MGNGKRAWGKAFNPCIRVQIRVALPFRFPIPKKMMYSTKRNVGANSHFFLKLERYLASASPSSFSGGFSFSGFGNSTSFVQTVQKSANRKIGQNIIVDASLNKQIAFTRNHSDAQSTEKTRTGGKIQFECLRL